MYIGDFCDSFTIFTSVKSNVYKEVWPLNSRSSTNLPISQLMQQNDIKTVSRLQLKRRLLVFPRTRDKENYSEYGEEVSSSCQGKRGWGKAYNSFFLWCVILSCSICWSVTLCKLSFEWTTVRAEQKATQPKVTVGRQVCHLYSAFRDKITINWS